MSGTSVAVNAQFITDATVQIGDDSYEQACSTVTLTPSSSSKTFQGMTPTSSATRVTPATWEADITFAQDLDTAGSLTNYLHTNEGQEVTMIFAPNAGGATVTATVYITPGAIGGDQGDFSTSSVKLPVIGKPVITPAAA